MENNEQTIIDWEKSILQLTNNAYVNLPEKSKWNLVVFGGADGVKGDADAIVKFIEQGGTTNSSTLLLGCSTKNSTLNEDLLLMRNLLDNNKNTYELGFSAGCKTVIDSIGLNYVETSTNDNSSDFTFIISNKSKADDLTKILSSVSGNDKETLFKGNLQSAFSRVSSETSNIQAKNLIVDSMPTGSSITKSIVLVDPGREYDIFTTSNGTGTPFTGNDYEEQLKIWKNLEGGKAYDLAKEYIANSENVGYDLNGEKLKKLEEYWNDYISNLSLEERKVQIPIKDIINYDAIKTNVNDSLIFCGHNNADYKNREDLKILGNATNNQVMFYFEDGKHSGLSEDGIMNIVCEIFKDQEPTMNKEIFDEIINHDLFTEVAIYDSDSNEYKTYDKSQLFNEDGTCTDTYKDVYKESQAEYVDFKAMENFVSSFYETLESFPMNNSNDGYAIQEDGSSTMGLISLMMKNITKNNFEFLADSVECGQNIVNAVESWMWTDEYLKELLGVSDGKNPYSSYTQNNFALLNSKNIVNVSTYGSEEKLNFSTDKLTKMMDEVNNPVIGMLYEDIKWSSDVLDQIKDFLYLKHNNVLGEDWNAIEKNIKKIEEYASNKVNVEKNFIDGMLAAYQHIIDYMVPFGELDMSELPALEADINNIRKQIDSLEMELSSTSSQVLYDKEGKNIVYNGPAIRAGLEAQISALQEKLKDKEERYNKLVELPRVDEEAKNILLNYVGIKKIL